MGIACDISEEPQHEGTQNPEQGTLKHRRRSSPGGARIPSRHNCQKHGGTAPDMGRYTRTEEVHCLRIGCSAPTHKSKRGTGKANHSPTTTSPGSHPP